MKYKAFISYKHEYSSEFARSLEVALQRYAKPLLRRPIRIFRDERFLVPGEDLPEMIARALEDSDNMILLASPVAARSPWVSDEVTKWCEDPHRIDHFIIVLVDGDIALSADRTSLDWKRTTALPLVLQTKLTGVPLYVDLRWARTSDDLSLQNAKYKSAINTIVAKLREIEPDAMINEEIRTWRRNRRLRTSAIGSLIATTLVAGVAALLAYQQATLAVQQRNLAVARAFLARAELSRQAANERPTDTALLAAYSFHTRPSAVAANILQDTVGLIPTYLGRVAHSERITSHAVDAGGRFLATGTEGGTVTVTSLRDVVQLTTFQLGTNAPQVEEKVEPTEGLPRLFDAPGAVRMLKFSPLGERLVVGLQDGMEKSYNRPDSFAGPIFLIAPLENRVVAKLIVSDYITGIEFTPDGSSVLATTAQGEVRRWRASDAEPLPALAHRDVVLDIAFDASATRVATAGNDGTVNVWSWPRGEKLRSWQLPDAVCCVEFRPGREELALGIGQFESILTVRVGENLSAEHLRSQYHDHPSRRPYAAYLFSLTDGREIARLEHDGYIRSIAFSHGGRYLATSTLEGVHRIWDLNEAKEVLVQKEGRRLSKYRFGPSLQFSLASYSDGQLDIIDLSGAGGTFRAISARDRTASTEVVTMTPNGKRILAVTASGVGSSNMAHLFDSFTGARLARWHVGVDADSLSYVEPDGEIGLARFVSRRSQEAIIYGPTDQLLGGRITLDGGVRAVEVSRSGAVVALGWRDQLAVRDSRGRFTELDAARSIDSFGLSDDGEQFALVVSPGQKASLGDADRKISSLRDDFLVNPHLQAIPARKEVGRSRIELYDVANLAKPTRSISHDWEVTDLVLAPDRRFLAAAGPSGVWVWKIDSTGDPVRLMENSHAYSVATDPMGRWLVAKGVKISDDKESVLDWRYGEEWVVIYDTLHWTEQHRIPGSDNVLAVAFSPAGEHVATGVRDIGLASIRLTDWSISSTYEYTGRVDHLIFSSDGRFLVSADRKGKIMVWEVSTGILQFSVTYQGRPIALHQDTDRFLWAYFEDGAIRRWPIERASLIEDVCARLPRPPDGAVWREIVEEEAAPNLCGTVSDATTGR